MQKLMGRPWSCWNLPEQPTETDLRKIREAYLPPEQYRVHHQSTPLPPRYVSLFGTHPDSDFLSITTCQACGWRMKMQHANKHFRRDSRGAIVCKDSDLAMFGTKVLGKAVHPIGELTETYSKKITLRALPSKPSNGRGTSNNNDLHPKNRSGNSSSSNHKTEYFSHPVSPYRSRSHSQMNAPASYASKSRSGSSSAASSSHSKPSSSLSKTHSGSKSHSSSSSGSHSSSWSSVRSPPPSSKTSQKPSSSTSGTYTLSIPSDDLGRNESVEDLLHIIATSNSSKSKSSDDRMKFYSDIPEKRPKLDSHSRSSDHHHKSSSDSHDSYGKSKQTLRHSSNSSYNGASSSHSSSLESTKKSKPSSMSSLSKNESGGSSKHQLRSTSSSSIVTMSKPTVSTPSMSTSSNTHSRSHGTSSSLSASSTTDKDRERDRSSPQKKKKRKRDKDEPRKIIPLKDRDFNPDKHCGVCVPGTILPCKRSLTCKTHSVALRRAVSGRSQSFDALLAAHKLAKSEEKGSIVQNIVSKPKDVVEEPPPQLTPPKPKKKKISGSSHSIGSSPNEVRPLGGGHISYDRSGSPDIEVVEVVKPKPKPVNTNALANRYGTKFKECPVIYPKKPECQDKFEQVWYDPSLMDRNRHITNDEKNKFVFLMKHYKNPFFLNSDVAQPLAKNVREKRNVFSNWNASEMPVDGSQHTVTWTLDRRHNPELDDAITYIGLVSKK